MPSLNQFIADRATCRFGDPDDPFEVVYAPSRLDADRTDRFYEAITERNDVLAAAYMLTGYGEDDALILEWNVQGPVAGRREKVGEDGEPVKDGRGRPIVEAYEAVPAGAVVPLDPDVLRFLPPKTLIGIFGELQEHANGLTDAGFTKTKAISSNGSRPR